MKLARRWSLVVVIALLVAACSSPAKRPRARKPRTWRVESTKPHAAPTAKHKSHEHAHGGHPHGPNPHHHHPHPHPHLAGPYGHHHPY